MSKKFSQPIRVRQNDHEGEDSGVIPILTEDSLHVRPMKLLKENYVNVHESQALSP